MGLVVAALMMILAMDVIGNSSWRKKHMPDFPIVMSRKDVVELPTGKLFVVQGARSPFPGYNDYTLIREDTSDIELRGVPENAGMIRKVIRPTDPGYDSCVAVVFPNGLPWHLNVF